VKLTAGKLAGMKAVSDARGVIAAAAMDQRGSLKKALAKDKGGEITDAMMEEFKALVTEVLTPHASAILLDPEWGLGPSKRRAKNAGLLLAYEKTGYDANTPGRLPDLLDVWSVRRLKEAGADCIKILLYYTPFDPKGINEIKHAWVERIGDECRANDIPFFLEFVGYEEGADEKGLEFAKKKPEAVIGACGVHEGPLRRGRDEGRGPRQHEVRRGRRARRTRPPTRATKRRRTSSARRRPRPSRSSTSRPASATPSSPRRSRWRRVRRDVQRRAVRPRHLEGRHSRLREGGRRRPSALARDPGRREHPNVNNALKPARRRGSPIYGVKPEVQRLIDDMFETMRSTQGIGLAAPQVHEGLRLFVAGTACQAPRRRRDDDGEMPLMALINPELTLVGRTDRTRLGRVPEHSRHSWPRAARTGGAGARRLIAPAARSRSPRRGFPRASSSTRTTTSTACCSSTA
jgi:hypothetical protein